MTSIRRNAIDTCYPDPYRAGPGTRLMMAQNLSAATAFKRAADYYARLAPPK